MIDVQDLVYEYPSQRALHGVNFAVRPQTIAALVGPNGAGKTTLLRCLAALELPYSGRVRIDGADTQDAARAIHARLGYLPDFYGLYDALTVKRCLLYAARAHGIDASNADTAAFRAAERVSLTDRLETTAAELSRGLRQRLAIGQAIVHEPKVLLLDEPASGLDPEARRDLSRLLVSLRDQGMTLVVSSHILAELEDYSDEMVIMESGRIVGDGAVKLGKESRAAIRIELASARNDLASFLGSQTDVEIIESDDVSASFRFFGPEEARVRLLRRILAQGFDVLQFADAPQRLEQRYFAEVESVTKRQTNGPVKDQQS